MLVVGCGLWLVMFIIANERPYSIFINADPQRGWLLELFNKKNLQYHGSHSWLRLLLITESPIIGNCIGKFFVTQL